MRFCRSRPQIQTRVSCCLPNTKLRVAVSAATGGSQRSAKAFGFQFFCDQKSRSTTPRRLTIWAIEAISDVIRTEFSLEPTIKLPNDVQLYGRKVAGVLVEMRAQEKAPHLAVVGVGINVNQSLEDFPPELRNRAISLAIALQRPVDRQKFAVVLLRNLDRTYRARFAPKS